MSESVPATAEPDASPVAPTGTRVEIREREAWSISGWFGVLVVAACIAAVVLLARGSAKAVILAPIVLGIVVLASLVIVPPGQTRVVRFFGRYVGTLRRNGLSWILPLSDRHLVSIRV